jgi:AraC-like DNA-binding protein
MNQDFFRDIELDKFLQDFLDHTSDLFVFAKDRRFRFTMMNSALLKQLNLSSESEVLGKTDYDFFQRSQADLFLREDTELFNTQKTIFNRTWAIDNRKGGIDWYISSKYPLFDSQQNCRGLIGIMRNTSQVGTYLSPYQKFTPVFNHVKKNISRQIEINELADIANLSVSQFERSFKKAMNITPLKFINKMRVDKACELLIQTNDTLSSIAYDCGFFDHSHFSKIFKKLKNVSPSEYRQNYL